MRAFHILLLILGVLLCGLTSGCRPQAKPIPRQQPKLLELRMYQYALATGGTIVNMRTREMKGFARGAPISEAEHEALKKKAGPGYPIYRICATVEDQELEDLRALAETSGLYSFEPADTDVNKRMAHLDECPPTLLLIYSDKTRSFGLPLHDTVKTDLEPGRLKCYQGMQELCDRLYALRKSYSKRPYLTMVSVQGPECKKFEQERDQR